MSYTPTIAPSRAWSHWKDSVRADYSIMGNAELLSERDVLRYDAAKAERLSPDDQAVCLDFVDARLNAVEAELAVRAALHASDPGLPDPLASDYDAWRRLAQDLRDQVDIVELLRLAGCQLERTGKEWAGPCPACGGTDRFRVWARASGRRPGYWCRQCQITGDAIAAYREFIVPGASFFDAIRVLTLQLGLKTPDHGVNQPHRIELATRVSLGELRHAG